MNHNIRMAEFLTRFLIEWHENIGKELVLARMDARDTTLYLEKVQWLRTLDLRVLQNMYRIAIEQTEGAFKVFYVEPISDQMWHEVCQEHEIDLPRPTHLGDIGHQILNLIKALEFKEKEPQGFQLPEGWSDKAGFLDPKRVKVLLMPGEPPRQALRRYFAGLEKLESRSIGGRELLVSMNEDLLGELSYDEGERNHLVVYNPASFEFEVVSGEEGEDNIVIRTVKGQVHLTKVILGVEETEKEGRE